MLFLLLRLNLKLNMKRLKNSIKSFKYFEKGQVNDILI
jgi:hypothetical protein